MAMNFNPDITEYIEKTSENHRDILTALRTLIHESIPEAHEHIQWGIPVFKKNKIFTYLRSSKKRIALGFYNIDRINDVEGILEGTGATMRHVKIRSTKDIDAATFAQWLQATAE